MVTSVNEEEIISQSNLTVRYDNILSNLSKSHEDAVESAFKIFRRVDVVVNETLDKENETLFTDLQNVIENKY